MMGTMFCQYETPCGWCTRLLKECPEKGGCKKEARKAADDNKDKKLLNKGGEYAAKFAKNHGISISEALEHQIVKTRMEIFNKTGM